MPAPNPHSERQRQAVRDAPRAPAAQPSMGCICPTGPGGGGSGPRPGGGGGGKTKAPRIVRVEWLDAAAETELSGEGIQFVNLPLDAKWVGAPLAANKRRLGDKPGFRVKFDQPGAHAFKVKLKPAGGNASYSASEKLRNAHFKPDADWASHTTRDDGVAIIETGPKLTQAGGDVYQLEAQDDLAHVVSSGAKVKTLRAVHVVPIRMVGMTAAASSVADCIGEFAKHHIKLVELPGVTMPHLHNVGTDTSALQANVSTAFDGSQAKAKQPYALGMVFTDHLAVKNPNQTLRKTGVTVGPGRPAVSMPIVGPGLNSPGNNQPRALWKDLVPGEGWFVSASFEPDGGAAPVAVPEAQCAPITTAGFPASFCQQVNVNVTALPAGTGTLVLTVNWVDRMRGGISLGGSPTVLVCTRAWWSTKSAASQNQTLVHELGHQFGLVPEGTGSSLDRHANQYTASGHVGSHCRNGVTAAANYSNDTANAASTCVMFGATNGKLALCGDCAPQTRKLDITAGWT